MKYWVYIIYSESTDSYYKGQSNNLSERLIRHNNGYEKSTQYGAPWKLVWCIEKENRSAAVILERKLKNLSRDRLIKLIEKDKSSVAGPDDP